MSRRYELTDEQWDRIKNLLPGREESPGRHAKDNRLFINAVIWVARTGSPWRDLPAYFGLWNSVFQRFNRWTKSGVWEKIFREIQDPDLKSLMLDSTIIRAHQHAAGSTDKNENCDESLGRSRGGFSTKLHISVDDKGLPVEILVGPGQEHDVTRAKELLSAHEPEAVIADKGYDSDDLVKDVEDRGAEAVIPPRSNRKTHRKYNKKLYKKRNLVERFMNRIKHYRRIATRYDKTERNYQGFVHIVSTLVIVGVIVNTA